MSDCTVSFYGQEPVSSRGSWIAVGLVECIGRACINNSAADALRQGPEKMFGVNTARPPRRWEWV